jgi:hypothetical protein
MAQEKPIEVNAALAKWLAQQFPALWGLIARPSEANTSTQG